MSCEWPCLIRPAVATDNGFVAHSWVESFHRGSRDIREAPFKSYRPRQFARVARMLSESTTLVACDPDDVDHLLGYVVASGDVLHYLYVAHLRRRAGLASTLLEAVEMATSRPLARYTHKTEAWRRMSRSRSMAYDPCLVW